MVWNKNEFRAFFIYKICNYIIQKIYNTYNNIYNIENV